MPAKPTVEPMPKIPTAILWPQTDERFKHSPGIPLAAARTMARMIRSRDMGKSIHAGKRCNVRTPTDDYSI
jgi:hypothetical protein